MNKLLYVIATTVLVVGFQNCTKTNFSSASSNSYLAALNGDLPGGTNTTSGDPTTPPTTPPTTTNPPGATMPPQICVDDHPRHGHGDDQDDDDQGQNGMSGMGSSHRTAGSSCASMHDDSSGAESADCEHDEDTEYVACIIKDSGKSLKLGLVQQSLDGVDSVAQSVCVTKAECLGDVAAHFEVVGAYERGYCEHNPNVMRLTDAQVKALLGVK